VGETGAGRCGEIVWEEVKVHLKLLIWFFALAALLSIPFCASYYFEALGESGVLGIADSIIIPIAGSYLVALYLAPVVVILTFLGTLRMNPKMNVLAWKKEQPIRSILATTVFGGIAVLAVISAIELFARNMPAYELFWLPMNFAWLLWALLMRSAFIDKQPSDPRGQNQLD
jgi:hypothetical protein